MGDFEEDYPAPISKIILALDLGQEHEITIIPE
jgi:hypothetical protein